MCQELDQKINTTLLSCERSRSLWGHSQGTASINNQDLSNEFKRRPPVSVFTFGLSQTSCLPVFSSVDAQPTVLWLHNYQTDMTVVSLISSNMQQVLFSPNVGPVFHVSVRKIHALLKFLIDTTTMFSVTLVTVGAETLASLCTAGSVMRLRFVTFHPSH